MVGRSLLEPVELLSDCLSVRDNLIFLENTLPDLLDNVLFNIRQSLWFMHDKCPAKKEIFSSFSAKLTYSLREPFD